jgi:tRNA (guanine37-N1)-methyltransferase
MKKMKITILTLFPEMFGGFLSESMIGRAQKNNLLIIDLVNLRDFGLGKHKSVDDTPYGGGAGMVLRVDVVAEAIKEVKKKNKGAKVILMSPQGATFSQQKAETLATGDNDLILVCGHYEGFDERIRDYVDEEISIGDYVLTGGELAAATIVDAVARLIPGVLGKEESFQSESFSDSLLEYPQYTRPEEYEGKKVPEILKGGNHAEIEKWRQEKAKEKTKKRRPDLIR